MERADSQPVPAQRDDQGPLAPVRRGMPGAREPADLPALAVIKQRAHPHDFGTELASPYLVGAPATDTNKLTT